MIGRQTSGNQPIRTAGRKIYLKSKGSLKDPWDNIKCSNIHILGIPEGKEGVKGAETLLKEIMDGKFPNLGKETDIQVHQAQGFKQDEPKETHTAVKIAKVKDKGTIWKESRKKNKLHKKGSL